MVSNAIQFITAVVQRPQYKQLFENEESLKNICEKIIIPNLFLRDVDIEIFEDNPEEYIRKDIERSGLYFLFYKLIYLFFLHKFFNFRC